MTPRPRRRWGPRLEPLEGRDLPSSLGAGPHGRAVEVAAARRGFSASFVGRYSEAPGRSEGAARRIFFRGGGSCSCFLHGSLLLSLTTPRDPSGPVTGRASLFDRNYAQTGNILVLDVTGTLGPDGRPHALDWTAAEGSSGTFTRAEGSGTLRFRARGADRPGIHDGSVAFRGRLMVNGATNSLLIP